MRIAEMYGVIDRAEAELSAVCKNRDELVAKGGDGAALDDTIRKMAAAIGEAEGEIVAARLAAIADLPRDVLGQLAETLALVKSQGRRGRDMLLKLFEIRAAQYRAGLKLQEGMRQGHRAGNA